MPFSVGWETGSLAGFQVQRHLIAQDQKFPGRLQGLFKFLEVEVFPQVISAKYSGGNAGGIEIYGPFSIGRNVYADISTGTEQGTGIFLLERKPLAPADFNREVPIKCCSCIQAPFDMIISIKKASGRSHCSEISHDYQVCI